MAAGGKTRKFRPQLSQHGGLKTHLPERNFGVQNEAKDHGPGVRTFATDQYPRNERPQTPAESARMRGTLEKARFCEDCLVADAVERNRSPLNLSLFSGNLTGKFAIFRPWGRFHIGEAAVPQRFFTKFPKKINRVKVIG